MKTLFAATLLFCTTAVWAQEIQVIKVINDGNQTEQGAEAAKKRPAPGYFNFEKPEKRFFWGIYAGYTNTALLRGISSNIEAVYHLYYTSFHGWTVGIPLRFQIFNWLGVQAEFSYTAKNYYYYINNAGGGKKEEAFNINHFLDFPVMANLSYGFYHDKLHVFTNLGAFLGFWAAGQVFGTFSNPNFNTWAKLDTSSAAPADIDDDDDSYEFDDRRDNRFDAGLLAGLGLQYDTKRLHWTIECRYNFSLTNLNKRYSPVSPYKKNSTFQVQIGVMFDKNTFRRARGVSEDFLVNDKGVIIIEEKK